MTEQAKPKSLPKRSELAVEDTWRLEEIFPSDDDWEKEFKAIKELIPSIEEYRGKLGESAETLYKALDTQYEISKRLGKLYTYAHMRYDQDTTNTFYQGLNDRAESLFTQAGSAFSYIDPEILSLDEAKIQSFINENNDLKLYKHILDELNRSRPHILSASEEAILAEASDALGNASTTFGMLNNADIKFPTIKDEDGHEVEVTHGRYVRFLESSDRRVREDAFKAVYNTYGKFKNTFASTLSGNIKKDNFYARVRHYGTARQAALDSNNIPESVYDTLVNTIHEHLPLLHRYVALRKKVLGVDELHMYDLYTPLVKDVKMEIPYNEAKDIVLKGLAPMGEEYQGILQEAFDNRWIDIHENQGKRSGAYSSGTYGTNPYILLNWQDNVNNVFTLAHELGHSVHSYYTRKSQPYPYANYSIFVAEVASTCNESLLNDFMLKNEDDKQKKLYILNHYLEGFRGTVFRQTMFAEFEHLIHEKAREGEALTADLFSSLYFDLNKKYFGNDIVVDEEISLEWARIPHFYYNYYVYQYATGFSAAAALSKQILEEGEPAVKRYIDEFLKAGSSDYPIEVLKRAGVDMTSSEPIEQALKVFEEKLTEMEQLLNS
ncbi:oligopeptidase F [Schinkia azotoformans MEV2011]|uniref:Oligopeptidase F n=1 Tax=Schinkia azotoformans MEV2011 TaxID=1348973 RepID=A0A072NKY9_SCHAZ|nr:oligoendopeptidase F [Schinkia azotoformans]KEF38354.1 oligopeptidase F [Schinkia azotoformans MEV2011]MEC1694097.1 oligoendopeptidase F [Schinkia azotoformans]MEC1715809.1 oligoendopeptidase F [Schinkia azotoformans]MEC1724898.1 oligoendopeptidase F [Schinkia azotoformans]MEC1741448.1 oligoendopeptidase F [Schinkia azotoformans]